MEEIGIDKARARLGDYVNDAQNGTPVIVTRSGKPAAMLMPLTRLAEADRRLIARALALADARTPDALAAIAESPGADDYVVRVEALGIAQYLLAELAALAGRLAGETAGTRP